MKKWPLINIIYMRRKKIIPYNPKLKSFAKRLRKRCVLSEVLLWRYLRKKQMCGYDFDRQKPIDAYIVDFFCNELMLAIEIDGFTHCDKGEADKKRQARLESLGIRFLRFQDSAVRKNMQGVLFAIKDWIQRHTHLPGTNIVHADKPTPNPSQEGNSWVPH